MCVDLISPALRAQSPLPGGTEMIATSKHIDLYFRCPPQEVDAITTDCLALQEQVAIYEEQLAAMERQHETVRLHTVYTII